MAVRWNVPPPASPCLGSIRLLCIKAGESLYVTFLGPMVGTNTHWDGTRSIVCVGKHCACHELPLEWKGYAPVCVQDKAPSGMAKGVFKWVLVLSKDGGQAALGFTRGQEAMVSRPGLKNNGPMVVCSSRRLESSLLPDSFDVRPYVLRACGLSSCTAWKLKVV